MQKIKNIIIFIVIALVLFLVYYFFPKLSTDKTGTVSSSSNTTLPNIDGSTVNTNIENKNSAITNDFLVLLSEIKDIKLDGTFFSDSVFSTLHDSSIILVADGTEGRPNPFAPFDNISIPVKP